MKTIWIILIIVAVLAIAIYLYGKKFVDKLIFSSPSFVGADLKSVFSGSSATTVSLSETITNQNNFSISVDKLFAEIYYQGQLIGNSLNAHEKFVIPANGSVTISETLSLAVGSSIGVISQIISEQKVEFTYRIKAILFGFFPFSYNGKFTY